MPIYVNLDVMMARRHIGAGELADRVGITPANLSNLKNGRARGVRGDGVVEQEHPHQRRLRVGHDVV